MADLSLHALRAITGAGARLKHALYPKGLLSPGKVLARKRTLD